MRSAYCRVTVVLVRPLRWRATTTRRLPVWLSEAPTATVLRLSGHSRQSRRSRPHRSDWHRPVQTASLREARARKHEGRQCRAESTLLAKRLAAQRREGGGARLIEGLQPEAKKIRCRAPARARALGGRAGELYLQRSVGIDIPRRQQITSVADSRSHARLDHLQHDAAQRLAEQVTLR